MEHLANSDFYLNYSTHEGFCNAMVEGISMGLHVFIPDLKVFRELNKFGGMNFIDPNDANDIFNVLLHFMKNYSVTLIQQQGELAKLYRERFSIEESAACHVALYKALSDD